jgi:glycosyltransferase involved in cell wall biosynthesis
MAAIVSIVIPCFNGPMYLHECLRSVARLAGPGTEVVVVDDGSTDDIKPVVERFGHLARYIWQPNGGPGAARNTGLRETSGTYVRFLDADDYLLPTSTLAAQLRLLEDQPDVGLVYAQAVQVDQLGRPFGLQKPTYARRSYIRQGDAEIEDLLVRNQILPSTTVIRRSVVDRVGLFRPELRFGGEDWELWLRIAQVSSIAYLAGPVAAHRIHAESVTASSAFDPWLETHLRILDELRCDPGFMCRHAASWRTARADLYRSTVRRAAHTGDRRLMWRHAQPAIHYSLAWRQWGIALGLTWLVAKQCMPVTVQLRLATVKRGIKMQLMR